MPKKHEIPRIAEVEAAEPYVLRVTFENGIRADIDLRAHIEKHARIFAPLRDNPALWAGVQLDAWGWDVQWDDADMAIPVDLLWRLRLYRTGEAMAPEAFAQWMERHGLTLDRAAAVLGVSRRQVAYYKSGQQLIPKTVRLACLGATQELDKAS